MVKGMEEGRYVLRFPDVMSTCICAALGGTSELAMPAALAAFIAPFVVGALSNAPWPHAWEVLRCCGGALSHVALLDAPGYLHYYGFVIAVCALFAFHSSVLSGLYAVINRICHGHRCCEEIWKRPGKCIKTPLWRRWSSCRSTAG